MNNKYIYTVHRRYGKIQISDTIDEITYNLMEAFIMIYSALVSKTFKNKTVNEIIEITKKANLRGIEWSSDVHLPAGNREVAMEIKQNCIENKIDIAGYASYYRLGEQKDFKPSFYDNLLSASIIEAPTIRIWAGNLGSLATSPDKRTELIEEAIIITELAKREGIVVSYEFHQNTLTDSISSTMDLLKQVPLSKTHWQMPNDSKLEENKLSILAIKDKITNVHVQNCINRIYAPLKEKNSEWEIYLNTINLEEIRYACIEFVKDESDNQLIDDATTLNHILNNL